MKRPTRRRAVLGLVAAFAAAAWALDPAPQDKEKPAMTHDLPKTEAEWKKVLTPEQFQILRQKGTEPAFTGKYYKTREKGDYVCAGCGQVLFASQEKYDSGSGWPSFCGPAAPTNVTEKVDASHGLIRTEVLCSRCGAHLGHVFKDGPPPTGLRYCINSAALQFKPAVQSQKSEGREQGGKQAP